MLTNAILTSLKAFYAGLVALLGSIVTVLVDDASLGDLTDGQWVAAGLAGLVAFGGVWGITNRTS